MFCSICTSPAHARGWCKAHYARWLRTGDPVDHRPKTRFERVMARVELRGGCLEFTGHRNADGYGKISDGHGGSVSVHRVVWEHHNGPIPPGGHILHHCDNPACVTVDHLFLGTQIDNIADMVAKGRQRSSRGLPKKRIVCDRCGREVTVNTLPGHQRSPRCIPS